MPILRLPWRFLRRNFLTIVSLWGCYIILSIYYEAWLMEVPVWFATKQRFGSHAKIRNDYFTPKPHIDPESYTTYKRRFQMEYNQIMAASGFNFTSHFNNLENSAPSPLELTKDLNGFMKTAIELLDEYKLTFEHPERMITNQGKTVIWDILFKDDPYELLTRDTLEGVMEYHSFFLEDIKLKHKLVVGSLPKDSPDFYENGSGYVYLGGGKYTWLCLLSIQGLRKAGSKLPVEIIIPSKSEYDKLLCDEMAQDLNVKCKILPDLGLDINGYQLKPLALLFSSFKRVLYLDSDIIPTVNPDRYFTSNLLIDYGLITWPDFWRRTTSPHLYDSLGIEIGEKPCRFLNDFYTPVKLQYKKTAQEFNFHDLSGTLPDWTTESGLLLVNKVTHFNVILLALYYNMNGPTGFYPLLSQGGAGEGDKDTWALSSHYLKMPWWQVQTKPRKLYGTWIKERNYIVDSSIVQVDLLDDYEGLLGLIWGQDVWRKEMISQVGEDQFAYNYGYTLGDESWSYSSALGGTLGLGNYGLGAEDDIWEPLGQPVSGIKSACRPPDAFYHIHSPKLDPWEYLKQGKFTNREGEQMRNFGEVEWLSLGFDIELWIWELIRDNMCTDGSTLTAAVRGLKVFKGKNFNDVCGKELKNRIEWLKNDGGKKMEKSKPVEKGWKLKDNTRLLINKRVIKCKMDNL